MITKGRIFVTGGNGFLGSAVVRRLCEEGYTVRCLLRPTSQTGRIDDLPVERVIGDLSSEDHLLAAMRGCDGVFHLASIASWDAMDSPELGAVVIDGTARVLAAALHAGKLRTVFVSSAAAINGTTDPVVQDESTTFDLDEKIFAYAAAKHRAERRVAAAVVDGLPVVTVNPAEIYGPHDHALVTSGNLLHWLRSNPALVCRGGTSVVHVDDVAAGVIAAWQRGRVGERYILGGENRPLAELARLTLNCAGFPQRRVMTIPGAPLRLLARTAALLRLPFPVAPALIPYATRFWYVSSRKAERDLGIQFRSARETLAPTVAWLENAGHFRRE